MKKGEHTYHLQYQYKIQAAMNITGSMMTKKLKVLIFTSSPAGGGHVGAGRLDCVGEVVGKGDTVGCRVVGKRVGSGRK
jgi:hypothetical protein